MTKKIFNRSKTKKLIVAGTITTIALVVGVSTYAIVNNNTQQVKEISKTSPLYQKGLNLINTHEQKSATKLNMGTSFNYIPQIITNLGPIIYNYNTISLLNWFGNPIWTLDLKSELSAFTQGIPSSWQGNLFPVGSVWANMVYSPLTNMLYILTLASEKNASSPFGDQYIVPINISNGIVETKSATKIGMAANIQSGYTIQYQLKMISTISNGNIAMYWNGNAGLTNGGGSYSIYNPLLNRIVNFNNSFISNIYNVTGIDAYNVYPVNIIPFAPDRNLLVLFNPGGINAPTFALGGITTIVVNNQLELIKDSNGNYVNQNFITISHINYPANYQSGSLSQEILNQNLGYVPIYYTLFSGVIEIPIYNKMFFLTPSASNPLGYTFSSISLPAMNSSPDSTTTYPNNGIFFTGSFDSAGQLFFNMATYDFNNNIWLSSSTVYMLTYINGLANISSYVDISNSSNEQITNSDNRYIIIPVPNQIGKMMLLNTQTGISVAISPNVKDSSVGNILGTLNGTNSFVVQPDFSLTPASYLTVPSQLTSSNINVAGGGVASIINILPTTAANNKGTAVSINNMDTTGIVTIEAWLNYLPWFEDAATGTPTITPITKTFTGFKTIQYFSTWNQTLPNNVLGSLPSLITTQQLNSINPFNIDLSLNIISGTSKYVIVSTDDSTGTITLQYQVNYSPILDSNITLNYTSSNHTYTVSNNNIAPTFAFLGGTAVDNINQILQLLQLTQNDLLPSQIAINNFNGILFINKVATKQYPLQSLDYSMVANNIAGTIELTVTVPSNINNGLNLGNAPTSFNKTFTGFNTISDYGFTYNFNNIKPSTTKNTSISTNINDLNNTSLISKYSTILPSQITIQNVFNDFVNIKGFDPANAFNVSFDPNNLTGQLIVIITLNNNYSYFSTLNIFPFTGTSINMQISGFQSSNLANNVQNQIQFVPNNNANLLEMQKQQASQITPTMVLDNLLIIGSNLKTDISVSNITLTPNNITGELSIVVILTSSNINNNVNLPTTFTYTYSGFLIENTSGYIFQTLSNSQLSATTSKFLSDGHTSAEIKSYIFANQNDFILQMKGFSALNINNISVYINNYTNLVYITYDFSSQSGLPSIVNNFYSSVYSI